MSKIEDQELSSTKYLKIQEELRRKDKIKLIIGYIISLLVGIICLILINILSASFGHQKSNNWMLTFTISLIYDIFIQQMVKVVGIFIILIILGSSADSCGPCRQFCIKLLSKSLSQIFMT